MNAFEINRLHYSLVTAFSNAIEHFGQKADSAMVRTPSIVCQDTFAFGEAESGTVIFAEQELRSILRDWSPQRLVQNRETWWVAQKLSNLHLQTAIIRRQNVPFSDRALEID